MSRLEEFLQFLYEDTAGYVHLSFKASDGSWSREFAQWPLQKEAIRNYITAKTAEGSEVFLGPSLWKTKPERGVKLSKDLFLGSHVLWAELDGNAPTEWPDSDNYLGQNSLVEPGTVTPVQPDSPPTAVSEPGTGTLDGAEGQPTARKTIQPSWINQTSSSKHQHAYWKLNGLLTDPDLLENLNRTIANDYGADHCWDATRVLRPPETTNYGIGKPERNGQTYEVLVKDISRKEYPIQTFRQTPDFRQTVRESISNVPDIREVLALRQWDEDFYKAFVAEPEFKKRSDQLMFLAYSAAESGFTDEEIYSVVRDADNRWKKFTGRQDRDKWLIDLVDRARRKYPFGAEQLTFEGLLTSHKHVGTEEDTQEIPNQIAFNLSEILELKMEIKWLIEDLIPRGGYGFIAGSNGIGKSQLGIRICESFIMGTPVLGKYNVAVKEGKAMFLSLEMDLPEIKKFFTMMIGYGQFLPTGRDRFVTLPIGNAIPLDRPEGLKFIEDQLTEHRPDLLVIDSLSVAMEGNFKDDSAVLKFNNTMRKLRRKFGIAIIVIHHNRKGQEKRFRYNELDDLYGSRFLPQDASFVWMLDKPDKNNPDTIAANKAKMRFSKSGAPILMDHINMDFVNVREEDDLDSVNENFHIKPNQTSRPASRRTEQPPRKEKGPFS